MRLNAVRKGRQCIRPEICRTYNFGAVGSSKGQYFRAYLQHTALNEVPVDWAAQDLTYLEPARSATCWLLPWDDLPAGGFSWHLGCNMPALRQHATVCSDSCRTERLICFALTLEHRPADEPL